MKELINATRDEFKNIGKKVSSFEAKPPDTQHNMETIPDIMEEVGDD